ncbi:uncharacterized protein LOC128555094 [Mercenaria mercenaria]|uniref:uncharacterized protein LOC128555094 n=1 Tax=Mercenaria mercenaria TaxID=6596 RepID=UPI00234F984B|nr:uncharacterized protein LOC128555094 [Mercenaria mercenaria]
MAEGRKCTESVLGASEEIFDYNCSPCEESGVYKEAHTYCNMCKLYYCMKCTGDHDKFPALRGHVITIVSLSGIRHYLPLDTTTVTSQPEQTVQTGTHGVSIPAPPVQPCENHPEEMIKMYCGEHDVVCCTVCIAHDHRECKDVHYILKLAEDIRTSQEYNDYVENMTMIKTLCKDTKQSIKDKTNTISNAKIEIINEIKEYKRELVSRIEELESKSLEKVNERYKQIIERLNATAGHVNKVLQKVTNLVQEIDNVDEAQLFVQMKRMRSMKDEKGQIAKNLKTFEGLSFSLDESIRNALDNADGLAVANVPHKILSKKEFDISFDNDEYDTYGVRDMCILDDDTLVITCKDRLKRFSRSFDKVANISVTGTLVGICKTSRSKELAVTIIDRQTIQFVQYTARTMSLTKSFKVGVSCKGVCCRGDYLFVTCGGGDGFPGYLRQYDMKGNLICAIDTDNADVPGNLIYPIDTDRPIFTSPRLMTLDSITKNIYIADRDNGIIVLDRNRKIESHLYGSFLKYGFGICLTTRNNILVSGVVSHAIHQYDENFRYVTTILNLTDIIDEMDYPTAMLFDESKKLLIVGTHKHNKIYVYEVEC